MTENRKPTAPASGEGAYWADKGGRVDARDTFATNKFSISEDGKISPKVTEWQDPDDAPDLSSPEWREKFDAAVVSRGRPKSETPKISTTIRLDADVVEHFRAGGKGWQSRINAALRAWMEKEEA